MPPVEIGFVGFIKNANIRRSRRIVASFCCPQFWHQLVVKKLHIINEVRRQIISKRYVKMWIHLLWLFSWTSANKGKQGRKWVIIEHAQAHHILWKIHNFGKVGWHEKWKTRRHSCCGDNVFVHIYETKKKGTKHWIPCLPISLFILLYICRLEQRQTPKQIIINKKERKKEESYLNFPNPKVV